jgi:hypothetical protein
MKTNYYPLLIAISAFLLMLNIYQYKELDRQITFNALNNVKEEPLEDLPVFIWNDDLESIPVDSTPILLEFSSKNQDTIYIGTLDGYDKSEYQFTITDDSITVTDFGRIVGTVKVEGQLEQLLIKDNE